MNVAPHPEFRRDRSRAFERVVFQREARVQPDARANGPAATALGRGTRLTRGTAAPCDLPGEPLVLGQTRFPRGLAVAVGDLEAEIRT